jgi:transposase InsO family protein
LFGKSRQAYYKRAKSNYKEEVKAEILLQLIASERKQMPRLGGRKLLHKIKPMLPEELDMGRDKFFDFLRQNNLLVKRKRYKVYTTMSNHWLRKYPNLIKELIVTAPNQLWVSDITYIRTTEGFVYLFLITDAYSRKIVGWSVSDNLKADNAIKALNMAISQLPVNTKEVIHHSDRGVQYCSSKYVNILNKHGFKISMTEDGNPLDNAIAERINGILKTEWLNEMRLRNKKHVRLELNKIIKIYNTQRPHCSLSMMTPQQAHQHNGEIKRLWKNYWHSQTKQCPVEPT